MSITWPIKIEALQASIRGAVAAALAVAAAEAVRLQFPLYAMIAAILVTDLSPVRTRQLGLPRLAGTILGAAVGATLCVAMGRLPNLGPLVIGFGILVAMFLSHLLGMSDAAKVAGYVSGVVLLTYSDHPWSYALYRVIETILGVSAAVLVSLTPKLLPNDRVRQPEP
jgi:uncharacterized membrane protein YgaE (UPF0421/DUF939 family)